MRLACRSGLVAIAVAGTLVGCAAENTVVPAVSDSRVICAAVSDMTVAVIRNDRSLFASGVARVRPKLAAGGLDPVLRDAGQKVITGADGAAADARLADTAAGPLRDMFSWCDAHDFIGAS